MSFVILSSPHNLSLLHLDYPICRYLVFRHLNRTWRALLSIVVKIRREDVAVDGVPDTQWGFLQQSQ